MPQITKTMIIESLLRVW